MAGVGRPPELHEKRQRSLLGLPPVARRVHPAPDGFSEQYFAPRARREITGAVSSERKTTHMLDLRCISWAWWGVVAAPGARGGATVARGMTLRGAYQHETAALLGGEEGAGKNRREPEDSMHLVDVVGKTFPHPAYRLKSLSFYIRRLRYGRTAMAEPRSQPRRNAAPVKRLVNGRVVAVLFGFFVFGGAWKLVYWPGRTRTCKRSVLIPKSGAEC